MDPLCSLPQHPVHHYSSNCLSCQQDSELHEDTSYVCSGIVVLPEVRTRLVHNGHPLHIYCSTYISMSWKAAWSRGESFHWQSGGVNSVIFFHSLYDVCVRCYINFPPGGGSLPVGIESVLSQGCLAESWALEVALSSSFWFALTFSTCGSNYEGKMWMLLHAPQNMKEKKKVSEGPWVRWLIRLTLNFQYTRIEIIVPEVKLYNRNNVASW